MVVPVCDLVNRSSTGRVEVEKGDGELGVAEEGNPADGFAAVTNPSSGNESGIGRVKSSNESGSREFPMIASNTCCSWGVNGAVESGAETALAIGGTGEV